MSLWPDDPNAIAPTLRARKPRAAPYLAIFVDYEGEPTIRFVAATLEDQRRLRGWLAHSRVVHELTDYVEDALEILDAEDAT